MKDLKLLAMLFGVVGWGAAVLIVGYEAVVIIIDHATR
jgi:hypothetical protein